MSAARPVNVADMIAWLRAHPDESFFSLWSRDRLLIGTRNDTGEICAWDCNVQESKMEYDRRASPAPKTCNFLQRIDALRATLDAPSPRSEAGGGPCCVDRARRGWCDCARAPVPAHRWIETSDPMTPMCSACGVRDGDPAADQPCRAPVPAESATKGEEDGR